MAFAAHAGDTLGQGPGRAIAGKEGQQVTWLKLAIWVAEEMSGGNGENDVRLGVFQLMGDIDGKGGVGLHCFRSTVGWVVFCIGPAAPSD